MAISPKTKKILAFSGGAVLTVVCMIAITKCNRNADERDLAIEALSAQTARVDSLQHATNRRNEVLRNYAYLASARGDSIAALQAENGALNDSVVALNDSIVRLDSLLHDCRRGRNVRRQAASSNQNRRAVPARSAKANIGGSSAAPASNAATNITVNGGNNNSVNINNGTVNNYYGTVPQTAPQSRDSVRITSSVSVSQAVRIKIRRSR